MKINNTASTDADDLNPTDYPISLKNGGKIFLETIPTGNGERKFKETVLVPLENPPTRLINRGTVMTEIISGEKSGETHHKQVLVIDKNDRPGVWHNGVERPRKQMIYDLVSNQKPLHPRDDVRNRR